MCTMVDVYIRVSCISIALFIHQGGTDSPHRQVPSRTWYYGQRVLGHNDLEVQMCVLNSAQLELIEVRS